jgi:hypothetical protein
MKGVNEVRGFNVQRGLTSVKVSENIGRQRTEKV